MDNWDNIGKGKVNDLDKGWDSVGKGKISEVPKGKLGGIRRRRKKVTKGTWPPAGLKVTEQMTDCPKCHDHGRIIVENDRVVFRMGAILRTTRYSRRISCFSCRYDDLQLDRNARDYFDHYDGKGPGKAAGVNRSRNKNMVR